MEGFMDGIQIAIVQFKKGDMEAFRHIIQDYQQRIYLYVFHMLKNKEDAEDITQDVFITAMKNINQLHDTSVFNGWIYKIAHNKAINVLRKRKVIALFNMKLNAVETKYYEKSFNHDDEFCFEIEKLIDQLNDSDKTLLFLRVLEDMNFKELSIVFDTSPASLRKRYERIRKKLRTEYETFEGAVEYEY
jgi:RNA polymerase sigma-70 factor (ECF subfamily)